MYKRDFSSVLCTSDGNLAVTKPIDRSLVICTLRYIKVTVCVYIQYSQQIFYWRRANNAIQIKLAICYPVFHHKVQIMPRKKIILKLNIWKIKLYVYSIPTELQNKYFLAQMGIKNIYKNIKNI